MIENLLLLNNISSLGIFLLEIITVFHIVLLFALIFGSQETKLKIKNKIAQNWNFKVKSLGIDSVERYLLGVIFVFSFVASGMILVYSEYFGVIPCALCWFERIFMYGIVVLSATALWRKDDKFILPYILKFSILGAVISFYHHVLQMTASTTSHLPCPASGGDCAKRIIFEYGHITFPWMAFIIFVFLVTIILIERNYHK